MTGRAREPKFAGVKNKRRIKNARRVGQAGGEGEASTRGVTIRLANTAMNAECVEMSGLAFKLNYGARPPHPRLVVFRRCARAEREEWSCYGPPNSSEGSYRCVDESRFSGAGDERVLSLPGRTIAATLVGWRRIEVWYPRGGLDHADQFEFRIQLDPPIDAENGDRSVECDPDCPQSFAPDDEAGDAV